MMIGRLPGEIKAIIGLGNPGKKFERTRHNIGFMVLDELADRYGASWETKNNMEVTTILINDKPVLLVKPQTFMNNSGDVLPLLQKKGITKNNIVVVHDELEIPFGAVKIKMDGSARGHNGLKSIIERIGDAFVRVRCGIGRPVEKNAVPDYVLSPFAESPSVIATMIDQAITLLIDACR